MPNFKIVLYGSFADACATLPFDSWPRELADVRSLASLTVKREGLRTSVYPRSCQWNVRNEI